MPSPRLHKLLLLSTSTLLSLALAEGVLRLAGVGCTGRGSPWFAGGNHPRHLFVPESEAGYTLSPGFRGREVAPSGEFDVAVEIDRRGMRSHPSTAEAGAPAVLLLGDSMTFGEGVEAGETFGAGLEERLGVPVHNGGVPGYASAQMAARYRRLAPALGPRLVVASLSPLWDRTRSAHPFVVDRGFLVAPAWSDRLHLYGDNLVAEEVRWQGVGPATAWAKAHSSLACLALPAVRAALSRLAGRVDEPPPPEPGDYEPTVAALARLERLTAADGARLLVVLLDDRGPGYRRDREELERRLAAAGIDHLALDGEVAAADWRALRHPVDSHWNAAGHRRVADVLASEIAVRLDPGPTPGDGGLPAGAAVEGGDRRPAAGGGAGGAAR